MSAWTDVETGMLTEMWLCGMPSGEIAGVLPRTRHSIMGKVDRSGMMKRKGEGVMPRGLTASRVAIGVAVMFPEILGRNRRSGPVDDVCAVVLAMVANGRRCRRLPAITGLCIEDVRRVDALLTGSGAWPRHAGPPATWWIDGAPAMRRTVESVARDMTALSAAA